MATFLTTTGISDQLHKLINQSQRNIILISPYLKFSKLLRQALELRVKENIKVLIIYGKEELQSEQITWLKSLKKSVLVKFCENLHAKCYANEQEAIVTSMNLHEYSQANNRMHLTKVDDGNAFRNLVKEVNRLIDISKVIDLSQDSKLDSNHIDINSLGLCIHCAKKIPLDIGAPYCKQCYAIWVKYQNSNHKEHFCHSCGKNEKTSLSKPFCYSCYKKYVSL